MDPMLGNRCGKLLSTPLTFQMINAVNSPSVRTLVLSSCLALFVSGCGRGEPQSATSASRSTSSEPESESHQQMIQLLAKIERRVDLDNPFLGKARVEGLRNQLRSLPSRVVPQRIQLLQAIGTNEFRLGDLEQGIASLTEAHEMAIRAGNSIPPVALNGIEFTLGVAWLRYGEIQNCVESHTIDSCLMPIQGEGIHRRQEGSTNAIKYFESVLGRVPDQLATRWLLNIAYMTLDRYPDEVPKDYLIPPSVFESEAEMPRFFDRAPDLGLDTVSLAGGVIADDFDGDRLIDLVVSNWNPANSLRFFRNQGDGTFADRTTEAGLSGIFGGLNLVQADFDSDGHTDVLVLRGGWLGDPGRQHPNSLLRNNGRGEFVDVTFDAGLAEVHYPTQTGSWADFDNDGDLDLYIGNENYPNQLFENQGNGKFVDIARRAGVDDRGYAKGVVWGDYDNDRLPDIYVSNMDGANRLFRNQGDGTFRDVAPDLGVTKPTLSFPAWFWDFNNDGALDLFAASFWQDISHVAADYLGMPHGSEMDCLYQGDGKGGFREVASEKNLNRVTQPMGSNFGDLDNDGFLDFYLGTGYPEYEALMPNLMFRNDGGERFLDVTTAGGFGHLQKGHGVVFADLDNDGDQDVFHQVGGWYAGDTYGDALFENPGFENNWIAIRLVGTKSNRSAIGARIRIVVSNESGERSVFRWVNSGGSFGANPLRQHIGLGKAESIDRVEVYWPTTDQTQVFESVDVNQFIEITEGESEIKKRSYKPTPFKSQGGQHHHHP